MGERSLLATRFVIVAVGIGLVALGVLAAMTA
jgi:hypothetical protein